MVESYTYLLLLTWELRNPCARLADSHPRTLSPDQQDFGQDIRELGTANLRTKIQDFRGFDSSRISILRGGIPRPIGNLRESSSQGILTGRISVGRLAAHPAPLFSSQSLGRSPSPSSAGPGTLRPNPCTGFTIISTTSFQQATPPQ